MVLLSRPVPFPKGSVITSTFYTLTCLFLLSPRCQNKRTPQPFLMGQVHQVRPCHCPSALLRQVTKAEGMSLATKFGCLFYEVSACQDFAAVQHVFHQVVRELRREAEHSPALRPLFVAEEQPCLAVATRHGLASCTINTLSTVNLKEIPSVAQAKLVTVKSSRAQSKRKAPTLTLLKGFKIF